VGAASSSSIDSAPRLQPPPLMKPANSAFTQPNARRHVSIRRGSTIITQSSSSVGEHEKKREPIPEIVEVEEEAASPRVSGSEHSELGNSDVAGDAQADALRETASFTGPTSESGLLPTSSPGRGTRDADVASSHHLPLPVSIDSSVFFKQQHSEPVEGSSRHRAVTCITPSKSGSGDSGDGGAHVVPFDRSPFDGQAPSVSGTAHSSSAPLATAAAAASSSDSAVGTLSAQNPKVLALKSSFAQKYTGDRAQPYVPGSRRTNALKSVSEEITGNAAAEAARESHRQQSAGDKSGWVDKMKKNIVGFFEGGDSDASSSEDEHGQHGHDYHAAAAAAVPAAVELDKQRLIEIRTAIKDANPPLVRDNRDNKKKLFGIGTTDVQPLTFRGQEFVDWLLDVTKAGEYVVRSRGEAVKVGEAMISKHLVRNFDSSISAAFKDSDDLYR
jgi:hypothetical protein